MTETCVQDQDQGQMHKTKTETKVSVYVIEESRNQDHGLAVYNTGRPWSWSNKT